MESQELLEFGSYLYNTRGLGERTVGHYLSYAIHLDLSLLPEQVYVNAFLQRHKNNSVVRGMMLNLLKFKGLHKVIDMPDTPTGRTKRRLIRPISKEEIDKLRGSLYHESFKKGLIFDLVYQGALRRFEVPTIKVNSFHWLDWLSDETKLCKLTVLGKGDKERVVLINPETAKMILLYFTEHNPNIDLLEFINSNQFLIVGRDHNQISERVVYTYIVRGSKKYLGRDIRTHELRHHRATELEKLGVPIRDIKNYLGHSNLATTEIYLHRSESESLENIQSILNEK